MRTTVWVTTSFVGFHRWPKAPRERAYLRKQHRHVFHVKVSVPVEELDRQVEFHDLKYHVECVINDWFSLDVRQVDDCTWSCEHMAKLIAEKLDANYDYETSTVEVSEDGECGAIVVYNENGEDE